MSDLIERQAAIDIVVFECGRWTGLAKEISKQIKQLPSAQPKQNDAEFWRKRSDEYEKMFFDLYWRMMNGVKFESMQFDENGITLKMKEPFREDNT